LSYAHCVREDPVRRGLLYLGTENAIYASTDDGESWQPLQANLPHAPVYWITVQEQFNDLVIATYGRGFWIMDDITPLQRLTPQVLASDAHLFAPRPAYRFRDITQPASASNDPTVGQNPAYGASINYYLKSAATGTAAIAILDRDGQVVRRFTGPSAAGLNRATWDLRYEPTKEVRLRTPPLYAPEVTLGPDGTRAAPGTGRLTILAPPGTYTVQVTAAGKTLTEKLDVRKDPNSGGTDADIQQQRKVVTALARDLDRATDLIHQIELVRSQIVNLGRIDASIVAAGSELDRKLIDVESVLIEPRMTGNGQDGVRWGAKLHSKLAYLANGLASADFGPTAQQLEVQKELEGRLAKVAADLEAVLARDVAAFNEQLRRKNLPPIVTRAGTKIS